MSPKTVAALTIRPGDMMVGPDGHAREVESTGPAEYAIGWVKIRFTDGTSRTTQKTRAFTVIR